MTTANTPLNNNVTQHTEIGIQDSLDARNKTVKKSKQIKQKYPISSRNISLLMDANHPDPFSILGLHRCIEKGEFYINAILPTASSVTVINKTTNKPVAQLDKIDKRGLFSAYLPDVTDRFIYLFEVIWDDPLLENKPHRIEDAFRFGVVIHDMDLWLLSEGRHLRPYEQLGAHITEIDNVQGVHFAVWAPNAQRVSVVGNFNLWDGRRHPMRLLQDSGIYEIFIPHVSEGDIYKYEIKDCYGNILNKSDPYAFGAEIRPNTASKVTNLPNKEPAPASRYQANKWNQPISIYEVHLGSWKKNIEDQSFLSYEQLAFELINYVDYMGFTHIEIMPISEYPFDGSWGYQQTGLYAPTSRFGDANAFYQLIKAAHAKNIGVILDWVPAHFPTDAHGLINFDGTALYEYADPKEGFHQDWNTHIYNFGRHEVKNFLSGNALYWLERFNVDGLRMDAVSSMIYRDYSRLEGEWIPNYMGGRENLEAISLLQETNQIIGQHAMHCISIAEESTDFSGVTRPPEHAGLGFHYKWNMGWMHDTLSYMSKDPVYRKHHHHQMSFAMMYHYTENFILPLSHDEVVHNKGSLLSKMPGDEWQKFANLRAYYGFMWGHPGKKLLFMGGEFAQINEWNHDQSLDWHLLDDKSNYHNGIQNFVKDLNAVYKNNPPLYELDYQVEGFEWLVVDDNENSVYAFARRDSRGNEVIIISNFTPIPRFDYQIGVNREGTYKELINSDSYFYNGSNIGNNGFVFTQEIEYKNKPFSIFVALPPMATLILQFESKEIEMLNETMNNQQLTIIPNGEKDIQKETIKTTQKKSSSTKKLSSKTPSKKVMFNTKSKQESSDEKKNTTLLKATTSKKKSRSTKESK